MKVYENPFFPSARDHSSRDLYFYRCFSCTVWTEMRSLASSLADCVLADAILISPRPPISGR